MALAACDAERTIVAAPPQNPNNPSDSSGGTNNTRNIPDTVANQTADLTAREQIPDTQADGTCSPTDPRDRRVGQPCTSHTQCETCYCYDEAYMGANLPGAFRFCSVPCGSGVSGDCALYGNDKEEYKCIRFTQALINDNNLSVEGLCMPACQTAQECAIYSDKYTYCAPKGKTTKWGGDTIQAASTCQTTDQQ